MKAFIFIYEIFKKFPRMLILNVILFIMVTFLAAGALFAISPIIDLFVHPDLQGVSPLTLKAIAVLDFFNLPPTLGSWLMVFFSFVLLNSAFLVFARYMILKIKYAVLKDIMIGTFEDFFNARWYFFSSNKQGVMINTFVRELNVVGGAFSAMAIFFASIMQMAFFIAVPFCISWQVTSISVVTAIVFAVPFIVLGKFSYNLGTLNTSTANHLNTVIHENLSLTKVVLGFGNQKKSIDNLNQAFDEHRKCTIMSQLLSLGTPIAYRPFGVLAVVVALFVARRFNVPLSEIAVLLLALMQVALSVGNLTAQKTSLENFFPSYEQINRLRQSARELKQETSGMQFKGFSREVIIKDLSFAYPGHEPVLSDINVRIPKGNMVAFVGGSGAGKSTLIDMIMGFHDPLKGKVMIDDVSLDTFDVCSYRHRIGYVPQDSVLFNMSIRDNLLWACESATDKEIKVACHQANADEFIMKLSKGYDTLVGDRGVRLSGGQRQRIALARAILRKPEFLILDEATSALDTYSEQLIQQAIENIAKETTVIVVAHRLSTIMNADYVYVMEDGRIVEKGSYSELVKKDDHFNRMVKLQTLETMQQMKVTENIKKGSIR